VLTAVTSVSEVIVIFSPANSIGKHSCVLLFSAEICVTLFSRRRQRWGNQRAMALRWKDQSPTRFLACFKNPKLAFQAYSAIL